MNKAILKLLAVIAIFSYIVSISIAEAIEEKTVKKDMETDYEAGKVIIKEYGKSARLVDVEIGEEISKAKEHEEKKNSKEKIKFRDIEIAEEDLEYVEPNFRVYLARVPNDLSAQSYGLHNTGQTGGTVDADIDAPEAWNDRTGNKIVKVAVIDTGINYLHPDLAANIWINQGEIPGNKIDDDNNGKVDDYRGWDVANHDNDPMDRYDHGTRVAGIIGAVGNNGQGIVGTNWAVSIMNVKTFTDNGEGYVFNMKLGIDYAVQMGADIISCSWITSDSYALKDSIEAANKKGILIVAAAGNDGSNNDLYPLYPASSQSPNVISVAATDHNDQLTSWSNYGPGNVSLAAPGENIYTTDLTGYTTSSGTSFATPFVSGVAALIKAKNPSFKSERIKARLLSGVDVKSSLAGKVATGGRLNANTSLRADYVPPSRITDLSATNLGINSFTLKWTAKGGGAVYYELRYSISTLSETNWNTATKADGLPKPNASGTKETFELIGLEFNKGYYIGIKAVDNMGNPSSISNVVYKKTLNPMKIVANYTFESGLLDGWTHMGLNDSWQIGKPTTGPGSAHSGVNVWATNLTGLYSAGTNAMLVSPSFSLKDLKEAVLVFWHEYDTQLYFDGARVEISTNSISWYPITPQKGYPVILSYPNPIGPYPGYSGYSGPGWNKTVFDLKPYIGNGSVRIRFHFGSNTVYNDYGWYVDDVSVLGIPVPIRCWNGSNGYLLNNTNQVKKFAKCAYGTYGYSSYSSISTQSAKAYRYIDTGNNNNWTTAYAGTVYKPVYLIKGTNGIIYFTNKSYYR